MVQKYVNDRKKELITAVVLSLLAQIMKSVQMVNVDPRINVMQIIGHVTLIETHRTNVVKSIRANTDVKVRNEKRGATQDQCVSLKMKLLENAYTEIL